MCMYMSAQTHTHTRTQSLRDLNEGAIWVLLTIYTTHGRDRAAALPLARDRHSGERGERSSLCKDYPLFTDCNTAVGKDIFKIYNAIKFSPFGSHHVDPTNCAVSMLKN
jgi:hypothetical protein